MTISPSTDLYLLKLPIELNDENQLTFANTTAQANYFLGLEKIGETDFTYQRRENAIRYPAHVDSIIQFNYVMYKNDNYSDKWFYARILNMEYINDGMTLISIEEDAFQTWQFDLGYTKCFVEREHVNDDTIGIHTVPENLETGEYDIVEKYNIPLYENTPPNPAQDWAICFCTTKLPLGNSAITGESFTIGGVFTSLHFFALKGNPNAQVPYSKEAEAFSLIWAIEHFDSTMTSEDIKNVFMIPASAIDPAATSTTWTFNTDDPNVQINIHAYPVSDSATTGPFAWQQANHLSGYYYPRNKKLFSWPYSYAYFSNKVGEQLIVHWEDFPTKTLDAGGGTTVTAKTISYKKAMVPSSSVSAKLYFTDYKNYTEGSTYGERLYEHGINFAKAPVCAWTTDYYLNWLTQNGVNQATSIGAAAIGGIMGVAGAAIVGGPVGLAIAGAIIGTSTAVGNAMAAQHQASVAPDNAQGDISSGDVMYAYNKCAISMYSMTVKPEYAAIIDFYFDCYGYKVNTVKLPNIQGRLNWNFVKTKGSAIHADIPSESCDRINRMFDNGITLWHDPATFRDYYQDNSIVNSEAGVIDFTTIAYSPTTGATVTRVGGTYTINTTTTSNGVRFTQTNMQLAAGGTYKMMCTVVSTTAPQGVRLYATTGIVDGGKYGRTGFAGDTIECVFTMRAAPQGAGGIDIQVVDSNSQGVVTNLKLIRLS